MTRTSNIIIALTCSFALAQSPEKESFSVAVRTQTSPPSMRLVWKPISAATAITVSRKGPLDQTWTQLATPAATDTSYTDLMVTVATPYEYRVSAVVPQQSPAQYIYSAINLPAVHRRGTLLLIIDNAYSTPLAPEIARLKSDLWGDGWTVITRSTQRGESAATIKQWIRTEYQRDTSRVKSVFLLGHVPVPYSGNLNPDGHPEHLGAWAADAYYADMTGTWTDATVNSTGAGLTRNHNIPGDGKFDQNTIPGRAVLQTGRVDFVDLPAFAPLSDTALLKRYLDKDHAYRHVDIRPRRRAQVTDGGFGWFDGEAFQSSGWRAWRSMVGDSFPSLMRPTSVFSGDTVRANSFLLTYMCGPGAFDGMMGVSPWATVSNSWARTPDWARDSIFTVFTMLFGSYFGDFDSPDNFMRAALANKGWILSSCWSGCPYWIMHQCALGEPIGYSAVVTQNNNNTYIAKSPTRSIHLALMGDPSLRTSMVAPPSGVSARIAAAGQPVTVRWQASPDQVAGYHVYRGKGTGDTMRLLTSDPVAGGSYTDAVPSPNESVYMVRSVVLEKAQTGTFFNLSQGVADSAIIGASSVVPGIRRTSMTMFENRSGALVCRTAAGDRGVLRISLLNGAVVRAIPMTRDGDGLLSASIPRNRLPHSPCIAEVICGGITSRYRIMPVR